MIKSFKNKYLEEFFQTGKSAKIAKEFHERLVRRLDALEAARKPGDMRIPGFDFHPLNGFNPPRYSVHVNGPWCVTFEFDGQDASQVDFEQYH
ncbi:type II toxin-antitoxin system RelE/ParE family toxin [Methylocystis parvus]|uniref:Plasmid maintenance system killer n=1 Tax=Methylocystis parvus TaxID=134 RepID=A0A6B8M2H1_9HYPH|nr:type II toxin-antitoxin system RelE/ParE family toxin [Methylocystis parvus]QGM96525.1 plasmid maintenance system killer [Methylocystis parvus]WBJ99623.1 type II toxin-antitoxin system RelE/ParE family toxin [Methylocystis parvus OBBP]